MNNNNTLLNPARQALCGGHEMRLRSIAILSFIPLYFLLIFSITNAQEEEVVTQVESLGLEIISTFEDKDAWRFALMDCVVYNETLSEKGVGEAIVSILESTLKDNGYQLVERRRLSEVVEEIRLGMSGLLDPSKISEVGKMAGANAVLLSSITEMGEAIVINIKVVKVESSEIVFSTFTTVNRQKMIKESAKYVVFVGGDKSLILAGLGSAFLPGLGQIYAKRTFGGITFFTLVAAGIGASIFAEFEADNIESEYEDNRWKYWSSIELAEIKAYRNKMEDNDRDYQNAKKLRNGAIIASAAVYMYGIINAVAAARNYNKIMKEKYAITITPSGNNISLALNVRF